MNIKELIDENKIDIILVNANLLDNVINFFSEMNNIKRKISIILIANNNLHNLNLTGFKNVDIIIIKIHFFSR